jgi:hypothetical protein
MPFAGTGGKSIATCLCHSGALQTEATPPHFFSSAFFVLFLVPLSLSSFSFSFFVRFRLLLLSPSRFRSRVLSLLSAFSSGRCLRERGEGEGKKEKDKDKEERGKKEGAGREGPGREGSGRTASLGIAFLSLVLRGRKCFEPPSATSSRQGGRFEASSTTLRFAHEIPKPSTMSGGGLGQVSLPFWETLPRNFSLSFIWLGMVLKTITSRGQMAQRVVKNNAAGFAEVLEAVRALLFGNRRAELSKQVYHDVEEMFSGKHKDYAASDTPYHDFRHTQHVLVCFARIMEGLHMAKAEPAVSFRYFELGLAAVLLHDTGYLKARSDVEGTGAKYMRTHVERSCMVAEAYLPTVGVTKEELGFIRRTILCTTTTASTPGFRFQFGIPIEGVVGHAVATADCLGQMSAPDYMEALPRLFKEMQEADDFHKVPLEQRMFKTVEDLVRGTPYFWREVMLPRLENELMGMYRYLARPWPDGENSYVNAINATIERIERIERQTRSG